MDNEARFIDMVEVDGERYDVWESTSDDSDQLFVSEFAKDNLKPLPPEMRDSVERQLDR